jgi:hypothetical protein
MPEKTKHTIWIDVELLEKAKAIAASRYQKMSDYIRQLIVQDVRKEDK